MAADKCIAVASFLALVFSGVRYKEPTATTTGNIAEVDFIVVGGGSGGAVVAGRLSEVAKWQVLLLEAGPEEPTVQQVPSFTTQTYSSDVYDWKLRVQKTANDNTGTINRARMLGGCSAHNGMAFMRSLESDHQCWEKAGARGWNFADVLPFYKKSENAVDADLAKDTKYHSTTGPLKLQRGRYIDANVKLLMKTFEKNGLREVDLNGGHDEGFNWVQTSTFRGQRVSTNAAFLSGPRFARKNLLVYTQAHVRRVLINERTKRAEGVEYTDKSGKTHVVKARREVIVSAGTYFSPQLLMVSGVGPKEDLKKANISVIEDVPGVGLNLQDHLVPSNVPLVTLTKTAVVPTVEEMRQHASEFAKAEGPLTVRGMNHLVLRIRSSLQPKSDRRPFIHLQVITDWTNGSLVPFCEQKTPSVNSTTSYYNHYAVHVVLLHPSEFGKVQLNSTDPFSSPFIFQKVFTNKQDVDAIAAGLKEITDMLVNSTALREAGAKLTLPANGAACENHTVQSLEWYKCVVRTKGGSSWGHAVGTCSIGSVVDSRLRVKGIKGLRVADASVMPCVPSGNTNAPTIMVGERAAEFIKEDNKH